MDAVFGEVPLQMPDAFLVGLIGAGIGGSLTPALHEREADAHGVRYLYRVIDIDRVGVGPDAAAELVRGARDLGYDALNITHPCKQTVFAAIDELSPEAASIGAVNTVLFRGRAAIGENTDHSGFAAALRSGGVLPVGHRVVLVGAGGAGSAIAYALLRAGVAELSVFDRAEGRAESLVANMSAESPAVRLVALNASQVTGALEAAQGMVNATQIGMAGHEGIPIDASRLHAGLWVADAVYRPVRTELIVAAEESGCRVVTGAHMAVGQAAETFRLITGVQADGDRMRRHFAELSGAQVG